MVKTINITFAEKKRLINYSGVKELNDLAIMSEYQGNSDF